jgi:hypothetical protein
LQPVTSNKERSVQLKDDLIRENDKHFCCNLYFCMQMENFLARARDDQEEEKV